MGANTNNITYSNLPGIVQKYLYKYSYAAWRAETPRDKSFNNIVVIPAIKEHANIIQLLCSIARADSYYYNETLFLFVINNLASCVSEIKEENLRTIEYLRGIICSNASDELSGLIIANNINIGIVDASSTGKELPEKEGGVGVARKIGMDLSLALFNYSDNKKKILICLDADCTIQANYLTEIVKTYNKNNFNAAYVNFEHPLPEEEDKKKAIICYEIFLRYYVLGLVYASSCYAIHTIGSTMICDYESYIKVEGMNKMKAAEDFYFMEKLCKNYKVHKIETTKVFPSSRGSWRVPFGTGQRVNRHLTNIQNEYQLYSPESFEVLKKWLSVFNATGKRTADEYLKEAQNIDKSLYAFLILNKFQDNWEKIVQNCKSDLQLQRQKHSWFDGFRTLKLIHYLRDNGCPQWEMNLALEKMFQKLGKNILLSSSERFNNNIGEQLACLNILREIA